MVCNGMHRKKQIFYFAAGVFAVIASVVFSLSSHSSPSTPLQVIQSGSDRGLRITKSSLFEGGSSLKQRRDEILEVFEEYFDFEEMSRRALGRPWKEISVEKQQEFISLFKQLLFNTYVSRIETNATPTTSIRYLGEKESAWSAITVSNLPLLKVF